jgi:hypothetical protein
MQLHLVGAAERASQGAPCPCVTRRARSSAAAAASTAPRRLRPQEEDPSIHSMQLRLRQAFPGSRSSTKRLVGSDSAAACGRGRREDAEVVRPADRGADVYSAGSGQGIPGAGVGAR